MRFGIIGHGRFGKLWADSLKEFGDVLIYDKKDLIDGKSLKQVVDVDILFLLVPISELKKCCQEIKDLISLETIVVDACSVKVYPVKVMKDNLPENQPIVATHPLFGPDSAKVNDFNFHKIVVCPLYNDNVKLNIVLSLLKKLELNIIMSTPEEHDKQMARSQALVHFIGRGLELLKLEKQEISTPDYQSLLKMNTMVENDTLELFFDMQRLNPYAKESRDLFIKKILELENELK